MTEGQKDWGEGLSAGNITGLSGKDRPNKMLRQATNRSPYVKDTDSWGENKYGTDMNGDPIEKQ